MFHERLYNYKWGIVGATTMDSALFVSGKPVQFYSNCSKCLCSLYVNNYLKSNVHLWNTTVNNSLSELYSTSQTLPLLSGQKFIQIQSVGIATL